MLQCHIILLLLSIIRQKYNKLLHNHWYSNARKSCHERKQKIIKHIKFIPIRPEQDEEKTLTVNSNQKKKK